jgi:hypothetical protein
MAPGDRRFMAPPSGVRAVRCIASANGRQGQVSRRCCFLYYHLPAKKPQRLGIGRTGAGEGRHLLGVNESSCNGAQLLIGQPFAAGAWSGTGAGQVPTLFTIPASVLRLCQRGVRSAGHSLCWSSPVICTKCSTSCSRHQSLRCIEAVRPDTPLQRTNPRTARVESHAAEQAGVSAGRAATT